MATFMILLTTPRKIQMTQATNLVEAEKVEEKLKQCINGKL